MFERDSLQSADIDDVVSDFASIAGPVLLLGKGGFPVILNGLWLKGGSHRSSSFVITIYNSCSNPFNTSWQQVNFYTLQEIKSLLQTSRVFSSNSKFFLIVEYVLKYPILAYVISRSSAPVHQWVVCALSFQAPGHINNVASMSQMDLEIAQLQTTDRIFHLLRQRNKNQHRRSKWWKWFSMLKRCVSNLIHEVQAKDILRAQARVQHLSQILLPRCHA